MSAFNDHLNDSDWTGDEDELAMLQSFFNAGMERAAEIMDNSTANNMAELIRKEINNAPS
jgi:hypothetical protein